MEATGCGCCEHTKKLAIDYKKREVNLARYTATPQTAVKNTSLRLLSAEIEICGIKNTIRPLEKVLETWNCSVVSDGSLPGGGFELNTHPASGDYWVEQISNICEGLQEAEAWVNGRAGCHIHIDARDYGYLALTRALRLLSCVEPALFAITPAFRNKNTYCTFWALNYLKAIHTVERTYPNMSERKRTVTMRNAILYALYKNYSKETVEKVRRSKGAGARYRGINLHSWFFRGTLEVRIPVGTIYAQNITNWGVLLANILDVAMYRTDEEVLALTKVAEKSVFTHNEYGVEYNEVSMTTRQHSMELLKVLSPTSEIADWLSERQAYAKRFPIEDNYLEAYKNQA